MRPIATLLVVTALIPALAIAQEFKPSANPVTDHVRRSLPGEVKKLVGAAELMPADKYSFHPTPAQMTFGQLIAHIVQTNAAICAGIGNASLPDLVKVTDAEPKDVLVNAMKKSFEVCIDAFAKVTDAQLAEEVTMGGRRSGMSRAAAVIVITNDWADHYSTAASYLRLNGILPPTAQPAK